MSETNKNFTTLSKETFEGLIKWMNEQLGLDENHTVVAMFEDNEHDEIMGWVVVEKGVEGDYPMYEDIKDLFAAYGK